MWTPYTAAPTPDQADRRSIRIGEAGRSRHPGRGILTEIDALAAAG
jgi:hypothetical protein